MQASTLARSGLLRLLCRPASESNREEAAEAAVRACLSISSVSCAWTRLERTHARTNRGGASPDSLAFELEVPVEVAGEVRGAVGIGGDQPFDDRARGRLVRVADVLSLWEGRARLTPDGHVVVGCSAALRRVELLVHRFAPLEEPVLVFGETGVGKELVARSVHALSRRGRRPFMAINCAAVPEELLVSELFGHRRGAFTGAVRDQKGRLEIADGSTLFLDEVGDMGPGLQAALLRVIEDGELQQLGDEGRARRVDVRIVAATNKDLLEEVAAGRFRADLFFRLTPLSIRLPPLRERPEDIPVLARHFVAELEARWGRSLGLVLSAIERLVYYPFPGNVRELRNLVLRAAASCSVEHIAELPLPGVPLDHPTATAPAFEGRSGAGRDAPAGPSPASYGPPPDSPGSSTWSSSVSAAPWQMAPSVTRDASDLSLDAATATHLRRVLALAEGNVSEAARILDIPRTTLQSKLERYGLTEPKAR